MKKFSETERFWRVLVRDVLTDLKESQKSKGGDYRKQKINKK